MKNLFPEPLKIQRKGYRLFQKVTVGKQRNSETRQKHQLHPVDLEEMTKDEFCYSLSRFIFEVIRENCEDYPGQTLYEILINLQMHLEQQGK